MKIVAVPIRGSVDQCISVLVDYWISVLVILGFLRQFWINSLALSGLMKGLVQVFIRGLLEWLTGIAVLDQTCVICETRVHREKFGGHRVGKWSEVAAISMHGTSDIL